MDVNQSNNLIINFLIPFSIAYIGLKGIFYYFSFEYSLFLDAFDIQKLFIDFSVFGVLFYTGKILSKCFNSAKNKPVK